MKGRPETAGSKRPDRKIIIRTSRKMKEAKDDVWD
jgi:hypothetical protein